MNHKIDNKYVNYISQEKYFSHFEQEYYSLNKYTSKFFKKLIINEQIVYNYPFKTFNNLVLMKVEK